MRQQNKVRNAEDNQPNKYPVVVIKVSGVDLNWNNGVSSVESKSLKCMISIKASQIEEYIRSVDLLEHFQIIARFDQNGASIEVTTWSTNGDWIDFEKKVEIIREELHRRYLTNQASLKEKFKSTNGSYSQGSAQEKSKKDFAAEEALMKFASPSPGTKMEIDFGRSGKEVVEPQKAILIASRSIDNTREEKVTGEIRQFDDIDQTVTLCNLQGLSGFITLEVSGLSERKALLLAQIERRPVTVKFAPSRNPVRPDKQSRYGRLTDIILVGRSNEKML